MPPYDADMWQLPTPHLLCYARYMAISELQLLDSLSRTPFVDSAELASILGEPHATIHRALTGLLAVEGELGGLPRGLGYPTSASNYDSAILSLPQYQVVSPTRMVDSVLI